MRLLQVLVPQVEKICIDKYGHISVPSSSATAAVCFFCCSSSFQLKIPRVFFAWFCRGLTDESEILKFLQHGTLVGLLPVPHPILIRKYQANAGTAMWFRTYMWGVVYLRWVRGTGGSLSHHSDRSTSHSPVCWCVFSNVDPPIWYDTDVRLFEIQRMWELKIQSEEGQNSRGLFFFSSVSAGFPVNITVF